MPFQSEAQRRKFYVLKAQGKISASTVNEFDGATGDRKLPDHVQRFSNIRRVLGGRRA